MIIEKDGHPYLRVEYGGHATGFTLRGIDPKSHSWLNDVLTHQFPEVYRHGRIDAGREVAQVLVPFKNLLETI